jgi:monoamine oxidase
MALLGEAGTAAIDTGGESWSREGAELARDEEDFLAAGGVFDGSLELARDESVDRFLQRSGHGAAARERARAARDFVEGFDAADPVLASAQAIAREWRSGVDWTSARPLGGYAPLVKRLYDDCAASNVDLRLATVATRIAWRRHAVAVDAVGAAGEHQTLRARTAIVTLPLGVLRHTGDEGKVHFEPELPDEKREAIGYLEMGHVVKVVLSFRTAFWERIAGARYRNGGFFYVGNQPIVTYWTQVPVRSELIVAWAGGPRAVMLRDRGEAERIEIALNGLAALFDDDAHVRDEFDGALTHDWSRDPFSRGAYSYVAVGGGGARDELARPVDGTLFFAGEATSADGDGGTVNGALETGERAAAQAAAALGLP